MNYEIESLKNSLRGDYFAWIGQNATTGSPHPITGNMSMYGRYYKFDSRAARDQFVADFYDPNGNEYAVAGGIQKMREFSLGCSMQAFLNDLSCAIESDDY